MSALENQPAIERNADLPWKEADRPRPISHELKMWISAFFKAIPGQLGCALRRRVLPSKLGAGVRIWDGVQIDQPSLLSVGARTSINRGCILNCGGHIEIGEDVLIGPDVIIYSQNHCYEDPDTLISRQGYMRKPVRIGNDVWIAARAVILPGVEIGDGAVVASGAVVTKSVAPRTVVAGVPAAPVRVRGQPKPAQFNA